MFRRRARSDLHRSAIRLSLFDAILLAPVIALPLLIVVGLALFSMVALLILTGLAVAATIVGDVLRRYWRSAKQPVVVPRRALRSNRSPACASASNLVRVSRLTAIYHVRSDARAIEARAQAIAVEQSVEMPLSAIEDRADPRRDRRQGRGHQRDRAPACSRCASRSAARPSATMPASSSTCCSAIPRCRRTWSCTTRNFPTTWWRAIGGPNIGLAGLRERAGAGEPRAHLLGAQAAGPEPGPARGARGALRARRHRLHQGRSRARRPGLFAVRGALRGGRRRRCARSSARPASARAMCRA